MDSHVNPSPERPRGRQVARTEGRILEAATAAFVARGYSVTIEEIAEAADVGARTVYSRFVSKALLLKRVVDVAIVGDTAEVGVLGRDWMQPALTASTAEERIRGIAVANRRIMERAGDVFAVASQAAAVEPLIAGFWQQGRQQHREGQRLIWTRMVEDGLPVAQDIEWLIDSASLITAAETYLLGRHIPGWSIEGYEAWLERTLKALAL